MQVVVKKSILFSLLKNALNEASRADYTFYSDNFLGKFEEEEEEKTFINSDVPLVANPRASFQISQEKPDVADPEYKPASKSGFLAAITAVLENVPDRQIEFAYQRVHDLLDEAMEKEDELNYGTLEEAVSRLFLRESRDYYIQDAIEKVRMGDDSVQIAQELIRDYPEFDGEYPEELSDEIDKAAYSTGYDDHQEFDPLDDDPDDPFGDKGDAADLWLKQQLQKQVQTKTPPVTDKSLSTASSPSEDPKPAATAVDIDTDVEKVLMSNLSEAEALSMTAEETLIGLSLLAVCIEDLEFRRYMIDASTSLSREKKAEQISRLAHVKHGINNNETFFIRNYESASRKSASMFLDLDALTAEAERQIRIAFEHGPDFLTPPASTPSIEVEDDPDVSDYIPDDASSVPDDLLGSAKDAYDASSDKAQFLLGYNAGADFDPEYGELPDMSGKNQDYKSGFVIGYEDIYGETISLNENKDLKMGIEESLYRDRIKQFAIFKSNIIALQQQLGLSLDETIAKLAVEVAEQMLDIVKNVDYNPDKNAKREELFGTNFAALTVYKTGTAAGPGGTQRATAKSYQQNKTATFQNRVKEEDRDLIIVDYLALLKKKYFKNKSGKYQINSGRNIESDSTGKNVKEKYTFDMDEFEAAALDFANEKIDEAIKMQERYAVEEGEEYTLNITDVIEEEAKNALTDLEKDEKKKKEASGFFKKYAEEFGFGGASGFRQEYLKYILRWIMMIIESLKGDRVLVDYHSQTIKQILFILSKKIKEIVDSKSSDDMSDPNEVFRMTVLEDCLSDIQQAVEAVRKQRDVSLIDIEVKSGNLTEKFPYTPGGYVVRQVNGVFFREFLREFDRDYTNYVVNRITTDKTVLRHISESIEAHTDLDIKTAKSLAEYWTGKKEAPVLVKVTEQDEFGDKYGKVEYAKGPDGKYPRKGGAEKLTSAGIDGELYQYIFNKVREFFLKTISRGFMNDFQRASIEDGESLAMKSYREKITAKVAKFEDESATESSIIDEALKDLITRMSRVVPDLDIDNLGKEDE